MHLAQLALQQSPPLAVPLRFFLTAPLFGMAAALLFIGGGDGVLASRWQPELLALTHLLTLGCLGLIMCGALLQLLAVLVGAALPLPRLSSGFLHISLSLGSLCLAGGFLGVPWCFGAALGLLGAGFAGLLGLMGRGLWRAPARNPILIGMRLALAALAVTVALGLALGSWLAWGLALPLPLVLTDLHLTWGLVGWSSLLVASVAYQVVPMFQITPQYPPRLTRYLVPGLFAGLGLWSAVFLAERGGAPPVPKFAAPLSAGLLALGLGGFALVTLWLQAKRMRKLPDVSLDYWRLGLGGLLICIGLWLAGRIMPDWSAHPRYPIALGGLFILGFLLPLMQGMLYKIVPFLVWLHLSQRQAALGAAARAVKVPNAKQVLPDPLPRRQFLVYALGLALLAAALAWPAAPLRIAAGTVLCAAFALLEYNLYRALALYLRTARVMRACA